MRAWRITEPKVIRCEDAESQAVGEAFVKIKILESSLSLTDKHIYDGKTPAKYPIIPGGACVGIVSEIGESVKRLARGNKVLVIPKAGCSECGPCLSGKSADCQRPLSFGIDIDGFLRDFAVVNVSDLYLIPDRITTGDELQADSIAISISAILKLSLDKGAHIVIVGATDLGIILAQTAIYYQMIPILVDTDQARLDIAQSLGIYYTVNSTITTPLKKIVTVTGGKLADGLVYLAASDIPLQRCFDYVKKGGECAIVGDGNIEKNLSGDFSILVNRGLSLSGISKDMKNVSLSTVAAAINILANKSVNVQPFIPKSISFEQAGELFESYPWDELKDKKIIIKNG